jgi:chemotaxis protein MotB
MKWAQVAVLLMVCVASSLMAGCNMVERKKYDTLEAKYHEQENLNKELTANLEAAKAGQADLQNSATTAQQRAMAAESESARLREEVTRLQVAPRSEQAAPVAALAKAPAGKAPAAHAAPKSVPGGEYILSGDMLTGTSKITLTAAGKKRVAEVAKAIKGQYAGHTVRVCGNTDSDPIHKSHWQDNLELSCQRAMVVARELAAAGVPAKNIEVVGLGQYHPVSDKDKAKNRRVVIEVLK